MATENYLLSIQGVVGTSYLENVLCFQSAGLSSTDTLDSANDLITAFTTHAVSGWLDFCPQDYNILQFNALRAFPKPSATAYQRFGIGTFVGAASGVSMALNVCPSLSLVPPMGTKSGGRIFLPPAPVDSVVDNSYDAAYISAVDSLMGTLTAGIAGSGTSWKLAIYSRKNTSAALVLAWVLSSRLGFQGRRRSPTGAV